MGRVEKGVLPMTTEARTPCPIPRSPAWCETHPNCLAVPEEWPGARCLLARDHRGQHKVWIDGRWYVWGVAASPEAVREGRRRRTNTAAAIAALLGLSVQPVRPIPGRRR